MIHSWQVIQIPFRLSPNPDLRENRVPRPALLFPTASFSVILPLHDYIRNEGIPLNNWHENIQINIVLSISSDEKYLTIIIIYLITI